MNTLTFSQDSNNTAYVAKNDGKWFVVVNEEEEKNYDDILKYTPIFSPDGKRIAYAASEGNGMFVVVDGKEEKRYHSILKHSIAFSPDSKRIAYTAREGDKWFIVVDGKEGQRYDDILKYSPVFSPDSKRVAYAAREGEKWFVIEETEKMNTQNKGQISFSLAQVNLDAIRNDENENQATVSKTWKQYYGIIEGSLTFSPDSKHLIYGVLNSDGQSVVVDGKDGKAYDYIIFIYNGGSIVFDSQDRFHYLARKGKGVYLVEEITSTVI
jgi:Tol biopolymer transport system component